MSECTLSIKSYVQMIFGSEDLKVPTPNSNIDTAILLKVWSRDQQHQQHRHCLGTHLILRNFGPTRACI